MSTFKKTVSVCRLYQVDSGEVLYENIPASTHLNQAEAVSTSSCASEVDSSRWAMAS